MTMPCMIQKSPNLLRAPHTPLISVRRPPRHHQSTPEDHPPQNPPATSTHDTPRPTSHLRDHPATPSPTRPAQDHPHINVDAPDLDSPGRQAPQTPSTPPLTPTAIRDSDLLRATLQGRALDTPLGWYRLQESWTGHTVKALRDLAFPGKGLHETILDLFLWRARQHAQGQHVWIPPIEWGQALTHNTGTNVTRRGTTRLRRAPAEKDHPADQNHPGQWEQATAPTRDTALRATGLRNPAMTPPPHLQTATTPGRRFVYSPRALALLRSGRHSNVPRHTMGHQLDQHHARPRGRPTRGNRGPHHPTQSPEGRLPAWGQGPGPCPGQITSGRAGYHLGLAMLCLTKWIKRRWPSTGTVPWIWAIPTAHTQVEAGPDTPKDPPPAGHNTPSPAGTT